MFRNFTKNVGEVVEGPIRAVGGVVTLDGVVNVFPN